MRSRREGWLRSVLWGGMSSRRIYAVAAMGSVAVFLVFVFVRGYSARKPSSTVSLIGAPGALLRDATMSARVPFADALADAIRSDGRITVTVHVGLADARLLPGAASKFLNGSNHRTNLCWGALYGVETHMANAADWRRCYTDSGDGNSIIRRVVFHRRVVPTDKWLALGVVEPFDVYVLACAWPASRVHEAMNAPIRDAATAQPLFIDIDGLQIGFGGASAITGYLGPNAMNQGYWDPLNGLVMAARREQIGLFYICSMSAVYLHDTLVKRGFYPVLFAREPIVPEAYLLDGMLKALLQGDLDNGFVESAAAHYAKYQKGTPIARARHILFR